jgi:hypothetical protein
LVVLIATAVTVAYGSDRGKGERQPYLPLAQVDINVAGGHGSADVIRTIRTFATARRLRILRGDFPKLGRSVTNVRIVIGDKTFFKLHNFSDADTFELIAYSHDDPATWRNIWSELVAILSSEFGESNVVMRK